MLKYASGTGSLPAAGKITPGNESKYDLPASFFVLLFPTQKSVDHTCTKLILSSGKALLFEMIPEDSYYMSTSCQAEGWLSTEGHH